MTSSNAKAADVVHRSPAPGGAEAAIILRRHADGWGVWWEQLLLAQIADEDCAFVCACEEAKSRGLPLLIRSGPTWR